MYCNILFVLIYEKRINVYWLIELDTMSVQHNILPIQKIITGFASSAFVYTIVTLAGIVCF